MAGFPIEQVIMRGSAIWAAAMVTHVAISFLASRPRSGVAGGFLLAIAFALSHAMILLGASITASYATAMMVQNYAGSMHYEVFAAICFVGGLAGLYLGAFSGILARNQGARFAGLPVEKVEFRQFFRFRPAETVTKPRHRTSNRSDADKWYGSVNMVAWPLLVTVIGVCLWHDAPSWFLLAVSVMIGSTSLIAASFKPGELSNEAVKSDANSGLFALTGFAPLGLALKAMYRFELVDWQWPLFVAAAIGLPLTFMQMRPLGGVARHKVGAILLSIFFCFAGPGSLIWSALQFANDIGKPTLIANFRVQVSAKHEQRGKYDTMYWINTVQRPEINGLEDFKVKELTYERLSVGGDACILVRRGVLPLRWYEVVECSQVDQ